MIRKLECVCWIVLKKISNVSSLADDVDAVLEDARKFVEQAEDIAPIVKRPRKAYDMGLRELKLGSLREGETLLRQAKKRAKEIIEWWSQGKGHR